MRILNHVCTNGKTVMEYIPETPEDTQEIYRLMIDGVIKFEPPTDEGPNWNPDEGVAVKRKKSSAKKKPPVHRCHTPAVKKAV